MQLMDRLQIGLDGPHRQPADFAQRDDQTDQADAQPLTTEHSLAEVHRRGPARPTERTFALEKAVLDDAGRRRGDLQYFAAAFHPSAIERGAAVGTPVQGMIDRLRRRGAPPGEALRPRFPGLRRGPPRCG